jgi:hypothetical protein
MIKKNVPNSLSGVGTRRIEGIQYIFLLVCCLSHLKLYITVIGVWLKMSQLNTVEYIHSALYILVHASDTKSCK